MKYNLMCNQLEHRWEVRTTGEVKETVFTGTLEQCKIFLNMRGEL